LPYLLSRDICGKSKPNILLDFARLSPGLAGFG
jgi:hypothetical protein